MASKVLLVTHKFSTEGHIAPSSTIKDILEEYTKEKVSVCGVDMFDVQTPNRSSGRSTSLTVEQM